MSNQEANREALLIHIRGLEATLALRNERIVQLEKELAQPNSSVEKARKRGYKEGWKACAAQMIEVTRKTVFLMSEIRKDAFDLYTQGENK